MLSLPLDTTWEEWSTNAQNVEPCTGSASESRRVEAPTCTRYLECAARSPGSVGGACWNRPVDSCLLSWTTLRGPILGNEQPKCQGSFTKGSGGRSDDQR